ncbi:2OG-Fe dioxygenase family protein [Ochrobactrum vermis]|uniref:2OG-Fe dioxygenase family protein n=1 Tax=Ochrobactrum vermis TaxID=1827297 RepID=A0ABU8PN88_9HYPH|nr:2OG-Fe dioxygenase family protein [Ochrobactrum vermis]
MTRPQIPPHLTQALDDHGYVRLSQAVMHQMLDAEAIVEWPGFKASWNALPTDEYMADGGDYWRRRFAVFLIGPNFIWRKPHRPHYQAREHNSLNGGVERWFAPVESAVTNSFLLNAVLRAAHSFFDRARDKRLWYADMHQFRIEASSDHAGLPTPEGLHRDGVDWVFMMAVDRREVIGGVSSIHAPDGAEIASFTLEEPFEAVLLDDRRLLHGVTPIYPRDKTTNGHRDVLVVTFKRTTKWDP